MARELHVFTKALVVVLSTAVNLNTVLDLKSLSGSANNFREQIVGTLRDLSQRMRVNTPISRNPVSKDVAIQRKQALVSRNIGVEAPDEYH